MMSASRCVIRSATPNDFTRLANLVHFEPYVHRHLDYCQPLDWIGEEPFLILEEAGRLIGALACPPDPPCVAWIRLFAAAAHTSVKSAWAQLWSEAEDRLRENDRVEYRSAIPLYSWFEALLKESGFKQSDAIVMLTCEISTNSGRDRAARLQKSIAVRPMTLDDLARVQWVDAAAFLPIWTNSLRNLEVAFRQASIATVAEWEGKLIGYQVCSATAMGGHLARLAVYPEYQGLGVGYALVADLMDQLRRRGARSLTVNTQKENLASLALYRNMGFELTGESYPIYQY